VSPNEEDEDSTYKKDKIRNARMNKIVGARKGREQRKQGEKE